MYTHVLKTDKVTPDMNKGIQNNKKGMQNVYKAHGANQWEA